MTINLNNYKVNRPTVAKFLHNMPSLSTQEQISWLTSGTGCPVIVICHFMQEVLGPTEELTTIINNIMQFYGYTAVIDEDSP